MNTNQKKPKKPLKVVTITFDPNHSEDGTFLEMIDLVKNSNSGINKTDFLRTILLLGVQSVKG